MNNLLSAFAATKSYRGKTLVEWLTAWVTMREADLTKVNAKFLAIITTWVVRNFQQRRKGGVPTGNLARFVLPESQKIDFTGTIAAMLVGTLRKRGLVEADSQPTGSFRKLLDAFDRTPRIR